MLKIPWDDLKSFVEINRVSISYFEHEIDYCLFSQCGNLVFFCNISKTPSDTTELDDFETNYKASANSYSPPVFTPTVPRNEFQLNPQGLHARRFLNSDYLGTITLSNKNGATYDYVKSLTPDLVHEDCIWFFNSEGYFERHYIESATATTLELEDDTLPNGTYNLSRKLVVNYQLDPNTELQELWGIMGEMLGELGKYDWDVCEVLNPETMEEIKRYDEVWTSHLNKLVKIMTPDGSPGPLPPLLLRVDHYHATDDFTGNVFKLDYITTIKD
jgi:hypothetical protein